MATSDQPSTTKPVSSPGKPAKTAKKNSAELTDEDLKKVSGGIANPGTIEAPGHVRGS